MPIRPSTASAPVFIVGAPRSGTTLLLYMLRSHPNLYFPADESHFMVPLYRRGAELGDLTRIETLRAVLEWMQKIRPIFFQSELHAAGMDLAQLSERIHQQRPTTISALLTSLFSIFAQAAGKARWGDKTPYYVLHLPAILALFPDAQIIHVVRDGRDVALSMLQRRYDLDVYNTYHAAKYWQQCVEAGTRIGQKIPAQYLEVRYEDILADPAGLTSHICDFLGEPYSPALVEFEKPATLNSRLLQKTPMVQRPVQADNAEKWRTKMSAADINIFQRAAGTTLAHYGYALTGATTPLPLPVRAYYRLHNRAIRWVNRTLLNPMPREQHL